MKSSTLLFLVLLSFVFFLSCGTESTPIYTLTTSVTGEGTITPSSGEYEEGETVTLTSTPSTHWVFNSWSGDGSGSSSTVTITMDGDKSVVGNFGRRDYPLTITIEGEGTVTERIVSSPKTTEYPFETVVELTPVPSDGWEFVEWNGWDGEVDEENRIVITVDGEVSVSVTFERMDFPLTITIEGEGEVEQEIVSSSKTTDYPFETVVQLTPVPSNGWFFWNYRGDLSWNEVPQLIVVDEGKNVTVTFIREGSINRLRLYFYDSNNNRIEWIEYETDGSINIRRTNFFDTNNNWIEGVTYNSDGSVLSRLTNTYDSNNNMIEQILYNSQDSVHRRWTLSYDTNNNRIETFQYNSQGSVLWRWTFSYDTNNNMIETFQYDFVRSVLWRRTYSYDSKNNMIEEIEYNSQGSVNRRWTYSYDSNNNLIEQILYNSQGSVIQRWTYSYDSNNNLIERFEYWSVSNKSNPTIQTVPFEESEGYIMEPNEEFPLYSDQNR